MQTIVPFDAVEPKTRLAPILDEDERHAFAREMLDGVLSVLTACGRSPRVLSNAQLAVDAPVTVDKRSLTAAVNAVLDDAEEETAVLMADLALATPEAVEALFAPTAEVVLVPGRGGGTNAFRSRHPGFRVDYHGASISDHRAIAEDIGATTATVDSFRLSTDIDEPVDLAELLLHGEGPAVDWLDDHGIELQVDDGRVGVRRT